MFLELEGLEETVVVGPSLLHSDDPGFELIAFNFSAFYAFLALENEEANVVDLGRRPGVLALESVESGEID